MDELDRYLGRTGHVARSETFEDLNVIFGYK